MKIERTSNPVNTLEAFVWNHNIVLQWRNSSKMNNCSWIINTTLELLFLLLLPNMNPSIIRPVNRLQEWILKIFLHSPEMNRSIFFSMHLLRMTKKMNYFLRNIVLGERTFPWFNVNPIPFHGNDSWWRASRFSSLWFYFCLWLACKIFCIQL